MGADFRSHRLYGGDNSGEAFRIAAGEALRRALLPLGYREVPDEDSAARSFVLAHDGRWLLVGDSAGSTERVDPAAFRALSGELSHLAPLIDTEMSDDAAVHFTLYRQGQQIDRFGNMDFPFFSFDSPEVAATWNGDPALWGDLLAAPNTVESLRAVWDQSQRATKTLADTARLFGWNRDLIWIGYTHDDEGNWIKYDEYLADHDVDTRDFQEIHFARE